MSNEIKTNAKRIVDELKSIGDYSPYLEDIADEILANGMYKGHWDNSYEPPEDSGLPGIRVIEENEYDNEIDRDDSDMPDWDSMIGSAGSYYIFPL